ncbi:hypothetical protein Ancab_040481 [Ancistrocladus abbreviatus]
MAQILAFLHPNNPLPCCNTKSQLSDITVTTFHHLKNKIHTSYAHLQPVRRCFSSSWPRPQTGHDASSLTTHAPLLIRFCLEGSLPSSARHRNTEIVKGRTLIQTIRNSLESHFAFSPVSSQYAAFTVYLTCDDVPHLQPSSPASVSFAVCNTNFNSATRASS